MNYKLISSNSVTRYTFSGKERDEETGYSYFGARHYNSSLSIWLSVDPMSDKYPSLSPYVYCANNPVKLVDPNGREIVSISENQDANIRINMHFYPPISLQGGKPSREERVANMLMTLKQNESISGEQLAQAIGNSKISMAVKSITRTGDNTFSINRTFIGKQLLKDEPLYITKVKLNSESMYKIQIPYTDFALRNNVLPVFYINNDDILYFKNKKLYKGDVK
ncbi:MAG: RHS repeat-associated core domain-containing protein [Bacteroidales bacterium]|nr:RHS repeat-associated core domain-containing protein [Bacteroidales bacterium]